MNYTLHILSAVTRPKNIPRMAQSLLNASGHFDLVWHIRYDLERKYPWGQGLKNLMLDEIPESPRYWVWILDDDNIAHPDFFKEIGQAMRTSPEARAIVVAQQVTPTAIRGVAHDRMKMSRVDAAQLVARRDLIGMERLAIEYAGDGRFIEALHAQHRNDFAFIRKPLCFYNRLSWNG